jgi:hypothetical protein
LASTSKRRRSISTTSPDSLPRKRSRGKSGKTGDGDVKAGKTEEKGSGRASEAYREKKLDKELEEAAAEEAFLEAEAVEEAFLEAEAVEEAFLEAIAEEAEDDDGAKESSATEHVPDLDADDADDASNEERTAPKKRRRTGRGVKANGRGGKKEKGVGGEKPDAPCVHSLLSRSRRGYDARPLLSVHSLTRPPPRSDDVPTVEQHRRNYTVSVSLGLSVTS